MVSSPSNEDNKNKSCTDRSTRCSRRSWWSAFSVTPLLPPWTRSSLGACFTGRSLQRVVIRLQQKKRKLQIRKNNIKVVGDFRLTVGPGFPGGPTAPLGPGGPWRKKTRQLLILNTRPLIAIARRGKKNFSPIFYRVRTVEFLRIRNIEMKRSLGDKTLVTIRSDHFWGQLSSDYLCAETLFSIITAPVRYP